MNPEVLTIGRTGVDIYPLQVGVGLEEVETFGKFLGGSATNVAVAAARLGRRVAVITRTGRRPVRPLRPRGAPRLRRRRPPVVSAVAGPPTPVTFCEIFPPDDFPLYFYRYPRRPTSRSRPTSSTLDAIRDAGRVLGDRHRPQRGAQPLGAPRGPGEPRQRHAHRARPRLPPDVLGRPRRGHRAGADERCPHVTVAVGNLEECEVAVGETDPSEPPTPCSSAASSSPSSSRGPRGVLAATRDERVEVAADPGRRRQRPRRRRRASVGALCHGLLAGWDLRRGARVRQRRRCHRRAHGSSARRRCRPGGGRGGLVAGDGPMTRLSPTSRWPTLHRDRGHAT